MKDLSDDRPAAAVQPESDPMPPGTAEMKCSVLHLTVSQLDEMIAHCLRAYPEEGCGLLTGHATTGTVAKIQPTRNVAASAQVYTVDPAEHLRIDRAAEAEGNSVIGVFHSHTHTDPYPSPTDVSQAPDPSWHYVLVSLRQEVASVRSYRIIGEEVAEEPIEVH